MNSKRLTLRHSIIKLAKDKDIILKAAREKKFLTYKERQIRFAANLPTEDLSGYKQHAEWEKYAAKNTLSSKAVIQNRRRDKEFPRQTKAKVVHEH